MASNDDILRGREAAQVLDHKLYKEAHAQVEQNILNKLAAASTTDAEAVFLRHLLIAGRTHRRYLEQVMLTGKFAEKDLEQKSAMEKIREKLGI